MLRKFNPVSGKRWEFLFRARDRASTPPTPTPPLAKSSSIHEGKNYVIDSLEQALQKNMRANFPSKTFLAAQWIKKSALVMTSHLVEIVGHFRCRK